MRGQRIIRNGGLQPGRPPADDDVRQPPPAPPDARELWRAAAACALLAAALFAPALLGGRCTLAFELSDARLDVRPWTRAAQGPPPAINPITPDTDLYVLPGWMRVRDLARGAGTAFWDGAQLCGYPLGANMPVPLFLPAVWVARWLPPVDALDLLLAFHVALAGLLAYRAARHLGCGPPAAALGAVGFALSGWMSVRWHLPHILYAAAYGPGLLSALVALRAGRRRRAALEGAACLACSLLAFPQVGAALAAGWVTLVLLERELRRPAVLAAVGTSLVLAVLVAAPQLRLSGAAYADSLRSTPQTRAATARQGLPPGALLGALLPEFFGRPSDFATPDPPAPTMQDWLPQRLFWSRDTQDNVVENALYPGALVLLLLGVALARGAATDGRRLLLVGGGAVLLALGGPLLARVAPGVAVLAAGNVKRLLVLAALAVPLAAALGLQALLDGAARPGRAWTWGLAGACLALPAGAWLLDDPQAGAFAAALAGQAARQAALLLLGWLALARAGRGRAWTWAPAALLALDLALAALAFNPFPAQQPPVPSTPALERLAGRGRVAVLGGPNLLPPTAAAVHGIDSLHGVAALVPRRTAELLACIEGPLFDVRDPRLGRPFADPRSLAHPLLDLLAVDTVVHADPGLAAATGWPVLFEHPDEGLGALVRPTAGPRAFLCGGARVLPDPAQRLALLADPAFDQRATVLVERELQPPLPDRGENVPLAPERPSEDVRRLLFEAPFEGVAVLAESWSEGWRVRVDGEPAEALVADHALLGVRVGKGAHVVEWSYEPPGLRTGLLLMGLGLAAGCVLAFVGRGVSRAP
jgi:hypothetical protein